MTIPNTEGRGPRQLSREELLDADLSTPRMTIWMKLKYTVYYSDEGE